MKEIVIITNIMAPYRVDLFNYLSQKNLYNINVIYSATNEDREWKIDNIDHKYSILKSKTIKIKNKLDYKYIHIPTDIIKQLNDINPDVVIGSEYNPTTIISYLWCKIKKKKFITWSDGTLNSEKNINKIQKKIRKIICSNADALIASSTKTKEAQEEYGARNSIFVSYLTVDVSKYIIDREYKGCKNIIYVGRLSEIKGIDLLLEALKDINLEYKLNIVGSGDEEKKLKEIVKKLGLDNKVNFVGFKQREELTQIYIDSELFILPTRQDCFGLVITEAMCCGVPVIASKYADGAYDLIDEGQGGYIVDPFNEKEMIDKIELILNDNELRRNMGEYNKIKVKDFSIDKVAEIYLNAINYTLEESEY